MTAVRALGAVLLALLVVLPADAKPPEKVAGDTADRSEKALAIAPLNYSSRTLANGLQVYAIRDTGTANVSVQVWYRVGSKDDPKGRSGFAHLFEHLLFKSTRNMVSEQFDRMTEDVGGYNNASTNDDYTNYFEVVPGNHLQPILWAEAERMGALVVDDAVFKSERDVVKEELRQRILAQPYGKLFGLYISEAAYAVHPYARPGIGSIAQLDAATVHDVRAFHASYYRPDNAVLVVAGNFDPAQLDGWVDQYFAGIKPPPRPIPQVTAVEPQRTRARTLTVYEANTPLPAVVVNYQGAAAGDADLAALTVLEAILSKGESSRLYRALVYQQQIAAQVMTDFGPSKDPGVITLAAIMAQGKSVGQGEQALRAEAARLRVEPVAAAELEEAQTELVSDALRDRETAAGKASDLAFAAVVLGSPQRADSLLAQIQQVTVADVQRVARKYLVDERRVVIHYLDVAAKKGGAPETPIAIANTVVEAPLQVPAAEIRVLALAPASERVPPPAAAEPVSVRMPAASERTLANGLRVIVASDHDLPLVSANLRLFAGAAADPDGRAGAASLAADLVTRGAGKRSATDIAQTIEALGAQLSAAADWDSTTLSLNARSDRLDAAFAVLSDVVQKPVFAAAEVARQRQQALDGLAVTLRQPGALAAMAASRLVYGGAPYGRMATGTAKSLAALSAEDLSSFHDRWWRPDNAVLVLSGDIDPQSGFALAERWLANWARPPAALAAVPAASGVDTDLAKPQVLVIDLPESGQAAIVLSRRGIRRTDPAFYPALVADSILGGGYSARLNQEIRIKRGLSYGARSSLETRLQVGPLSASTQTKNESAVAVVELMIGEFQRLGSSETGAAELTARKAVLIGGFGRSVETTAGVADALSELALYQLPLSTLDNHVAAIQSVSASAVQAIGSSLFNPGNASIVVVGDSRKFLAKLQAQFPALRKIVISELDPDSPSLK